MPFCSSLSMSGGLTPATRRALRVVSLLPSATENVCALLSACRSNASSSSSSAAAIPELVGRSHECDFPRDASVQRLPALTAARTAFTSSADTHNQVREALANAASLYHLDADALAALRPDVILTQSTCKVCSIDLASVQAAVGEEDHQKQLVDSLVQSNGPASSMEGSCQLTSSSDQHLTQIVTCNPTSLVDALVTQFQQLGDALGVPDVGRAMADEHADKLQHLKRQAEALVAAKGGKKPRVLMVEWLEPLFLGTKGWMCEIVEAAGGEVVESLDGEVDPPVDAVVVALCGLSLDKTETELLEGRVGDWWKTLLDRPGAAALPSVYIVDGTSMFTRPTRRLLLALEWLVHALHEPESTWMKSSTFPYKLFDTSLVASDAKAKEEAKSVEMLEIEELHRVACTNKQAMYTDPATGYSVMTAYILKERQVCCGNGCRHCPYGHANVKDPSRRKNTLAGNVFLQPRRRSRGFAKDSPGGQLLWPEGASADGPNDLVVVFWSGGKDSFLALSALYETYAAEQKPMPRVVLLTTIDPETNVVPIQNISAQTIAAQAEALELPLCLVAVGLGDAYTAALRSSLRDIPEQLKRVKKSKARGQDEANLLVSSLVFGDLHLEDIRAWREQTFSQDYKLRFPVWKKDYASELLPSLSRLCAKTGAKIFFSNVDEECAGVKGTAWKVGQEFDWKLVEERNKTLAPDAKQVDLMGECGEFHTCVKFPGMD
jgi:diphthamide synthase (EF-2-diphthine--ammonia ligase)/ABC-type Fe3+-hydroxamate transport system substrate-binding protein